MDANGSGLKINHEILGLLTFVDVCWHSLEPSRDEYPAGTASVRTGGCGGYTETLRDILSFVSCVGQSQSPRFQVSRCLFKMFVQHVSSHVQPFYKHASFFT